MLSIRIINLSINTALPAVFFFYCDCAKCAVITSARIIVLC